MNIFFIKGTKEWSFFITFAACLVVKTFLFDRMYES